MPLANSFWLDETLIVWTIRDGFRQIVPNASISLQSIVYCWLEWLVSHALNAGEFPLRLPSLAAAVSSLYVYYRIGVEILDRETGVILASLYLLVPQVAFEAVDVRPYSLALLAEAGAVLWLLRWLGSRRLRDGLWWIACAAGACYLHHLFVMPLAMEGVFAAWRIVRDRAVSLRQFVVCVLVSMVLLAPLVPRALTLSREAQLLSFADVPTISALLLAIFPVFVLAPAVVIGLLNRLEGTRLQWTLIPDRSATLVLGVLMLFIPAVVLFEISRWSNVQLFDARYLLPTVPGFVLLWGVLLRALGPPSVRRLSLAAGLVVCALVVGRFSEVPHYRADDWRAAVRGTPESGALLVYSSLVETRRLDWLQQPDRWSYLIAPIVVYRPDVRPTDGFLVPFDFGDADRAYMGQLLDEQIANRDTVTLVVRHLFSGPDWSRWLSERLVRANYRAESDIRYGSVEVAVFRRDQLK